MALSLIGVGTTANDGTGDPLRTAFQTVNTALTAVNNAVVVGTGTTTFKDDSGTYGVAVASNGDVTFTNAGATTGMAWDASANSNTGALGIGPTSPNGRLDMTGTVSRATFFMDSVGQMLQISQDPVGPGKVLLSKNVALQITGANGNSNDVASVGLITPEVGVASGASRVDFAASRSTIAEINAGTRNAVQSGDILGIISFIGDDTTDMRQHGAQITVTANATATANSVPSDMQIMVHKAGEIALGTNNTVRFTIKSDGVVNIASLPTSSAGLVTGDLWNNSGVLNVA